MHTCTVFHLLASSSTHVLFCSVPRCFPWHTEIFLAQMFRPTFPPRQPITNPISLIGTGNILNGQMGAPTLAIWAALSVASEELAVLAVSGVASAALAVAASRSAAASAVASAASAVASAASAVVSAELGAASAELGAASAELGAASAELGESVASAAALAASAVAELAEAAGMADSFKEAGFHKADNLASQVLAGSLV